MYRYVEIIKYKEVKNAIMGFTCTGALGAPSVCSITCGDGVKAASEQCDNGNQTGCKTGCVPDLGFTCIGALGTPSVCFPKSCGNSIL